MCLDAHLSVSAVRTRTASAGWCAALSSVSSAPPTRPAPPSSRARRSVQRIAAAYYNQCDEDAPCRSPETCTEDGRCVVLGGGGVELPSAVGFSPSNLGLPSSPPDRLTWTNNLAYLLRSRGLFSSDCQTYSALHDVSPMCCQGYTESCLTAPDPRRLGSFINRQHEATLPSFGAIQSALYQERVVLYLCCDQQLCDLTLVTRMERDTRKRTASFKGYHPATSRGYIEVMLPDNDQCMSYIF